MDTAQNLLQELGLTDEQTAELKGLLAQNPMAALMAFNKYDIDPAKIQVLTAKLMANPALMAELMQKADIDANQASAIKDQMGL